ncbi:MAG TPA: transglutaminase domain-containing protein [Fimbriiglobus sp.]|jgi:transglutaminase-like putative cysteine protease|nr:transglutaminase domain-containing protein [Fimbriiglobus sp.]
MLSVLLLASTLAAPQARTFTFTYEAEITGLPAGQTARVWVPVPPSGAEQTVAVLGKQSPGTSKLTRETEYGNAIWYVEATPDAVGTLKLSAKYKVTRRSAAAGKLDVPHVERLLKPDRLVPIDGKPLSLIADRKLPADPAVKARALYDVVFGHMKYRKDLDGWGRGDASWACDSKGGNCSDFHSLFIALARSQKLPARFEMGYGLPVEPGKGEVGGYHCWARVRAGEAWLPVDISEASKLGAEPDDYFGKLPPNRVLFSIGRDITLEPRQVGGPLNFFINPHVEVGGAPHPADKVKVKTAFADE